MSTGSTSSVPFFVTGLDDFNLVINFSTESSILRNIGFRSPTSFRLEITYVPNNCSDLGRSSLKTICFRMNDIVIAGRYFGVVFCGCDISVGGGRGGGVVAHIDLTSYP